MSDQSVTRLSKLVRLSLGGAVLGIAVAGIVAGAIGAVDKSTFDVIGATLGGGGAAILVKLANLA